MSSKLDLLKKQNNVLQAQLEVEMAKTPAFPMVHCLYLEERKKP